MTILSYRSGYKYVVHAPVRYDCGIRDVKATGNGSFVHLDTDGVLTIARGYAWDGPSGPTIDTDNFIAPSLVHDALYQLIREGKISWNLRKHADDLLWRMCRERGMSRIRAWWVHRAVRRWGKGANVARKVYQVR